MQRFLLRSVVLTGIFLASPFQTPAEAQTLSIGPRGVHYSGYGQGHYGRYNGANRGYYGNSGYSGYGNGPYIYGNGRAARFPYNNQHNYGSNLYNNGYQYSNGYNYNNTGNYGWQSYIPGNGQSYYGGFNSFDW